MRHALHQATVTREHPGVVVHDLEARPVVAFGKAALRERHPDGVRDPLAERPGGRLDAEVRRVLRVAGGVVAELEKFRISSIDSG